MCSLLVIIDNDLFDFIDQRVDARYLLREDNTGLAVPVTQAVMSVEFALGSRSRICVCL